MRVDLTRKWDWKVPGRRAMIAFPPGIHVMTRDQAAQAVAEKAGTLVGKKKADPNGRSD